MQVPHGRRHPPRQERRPRRQAFDLALADGLQAQMSDLVIGAACAETEQAGGRASLKFGGERGQFAEQTVVIDKLVGAAHFLGYFTESLDPVDRRQQALRLRQAKQRKRSVGLQLDDALDHGPARSLPSPRSSTRMRTKPAASAWKSVANKARPSEFSATARLARSNSFVDRQLFLFSARRCRSSATSSGPGCGKLRHRRRQRRGVGMEWARVR